MVHMEIGSPGNRDPHPMRDGQRIVEKEPGLPGQTDAAPCLAELIEEAEESKRPDGAQLLRNTVDTGQRLRLYPEKGAGTQRLCGRTACQAECEITIGSYYRLTDVGYLLEGLPRANCIEHPVKRKMYKALQFLSRA